MQGKLQLRPSTRIVTTVTTTTVHYEPIEIPVPDGPALSGNYRADRQRYPLELSGSSLGDSIAMPTMLGMADYAPSGSGGHDGVQAAASNASGDRKGKRRMADLDEPAAVAPAGGGGDSATVGIGGPDAKRRRVTAASGSQQRRLLPPSPGLSPEPDEQYTHAQPNAQQLQLLQVPKEDYQLTTLLSMKQLVGCFASLSPSLQIHTLHQLLRQSPTTVIQSLNSLIQPALKRDFISDLPPELAIHIMSFLDVKDVMTCLRVSRFWKSFVDGQGEVWSRLLKSDGLWANASGDLEARECELLSRVGTRKRNGKELSVQDLIGMEDGRADAFHNRWRAGTWNEHYDEAEAARPTYAKLPTSSARVSRTLDRTLRKTDSRPQIHRQAKSKNALATPTSSPPPAIGQSGDQSPTGRSHYINPLKLLYKKRKVTRRHWYRPRQPHRITFPALHSNIVTALQFDNQRLVIASDNHSIDVYDPVTGHLKMRLSGHDGGVWALQYIGNVLVSGSTDRSTRVWDLDTGKCTHIFTGHTSTVRCLQIVEPVNVNPDHSGEPVWEPPCPLIVTGARDTTIRVWKLPFPGTARGLSSLQPYAPPSPTEDGKETARNPYHLRCLKGHTQAVRAVAAYGRRLVSGSYDCTLRVWDLLTGECKFLLQGHTGKVYSVIVDDSRNRCASGSLDGTVRIWSLANGDCIHRLDGHSSLVGLLENSLHYLVSAGADSTLKIWNPDSGAHISTLSAHAGAITCFRHDDFRVVSGTDGQLKMWDIRKGRAIRDLMHDMNGVWQVSFSDRFVIAAVQRGNVNEFESECSRSPRQASPSDRTAP